MLRLLIRLTFFDPNLMIEVSYVYSEGMQGSVIVQIPVRDRRQPNRDKIRNRGIWELLSINSPYYQISFLVLQPIESSLSIEKLMDSCQ